MKIILISTNISISVLLAPSSSPLATLFPSVSFSCFFGLLLFDPKSSWCHSHFALAHGPAEFLLDMSGRFRHSYSVPNRARRPVSRSSGSQSLVRTPTSKAPAEGQASTKSVAKGGFGPGSIMKKVRLHSLSPMPYAAVGSIAKVES